MRGPERYHPTMSDPIDPSPDEFAGDFAPDDASGLSDAELRELARRASDAGDEPLRRLVASYITLRRLSAEMLTLVAAREGAVTILRTPLFRRLEHLTRRSSA